MAYLRESNQAMKAVNSTSLLDAGVLVIDLIPWVEFLK
jgi:hypothetical protein